MCELEGLKGLVVEGSATICIMMTLLLMSSAGVVHSIMVIAQTI